MWLSVFENIVLFHRSVLQHPILKVACVNLIRSWKTAILHLFSQETDLLMKVIMNCVNIKFWDILGCFHYILNAPRILTHTSNAKCFRNVTLINIRGLAEIIVPVRGYADIHPTRL